MLAEVPELAGLLEDLTAIDRLVVRVIDTLILAEDTSLSEAATGLPIERWLAGLAGRTRSDRQMLQTAASACRRLPGVHGAFRAGRLSWAQLRAIALRIQRLPRQHDEAIDDELVRAVGLAGRRPDPDSLLHVISQVLDAHQHPASDGERPEGAPEVDFLAMQPRLDGSGGTLYGDFGPEGFAAIDNRLAPDTPDTGARDGFGPTPTRIVPQRPAGSSDRAVPRSSSDCAPPTPAMAPPPPPRMSCGSMSRPCYGSPPTVPRRC
jgi:hypothetical protein